MPWYRRLLRRGDKTSYEAGQRPDDLGKRRWRPGCLTIIIVVLLILLIGGGALYAFNDGVRTSVNDTIRTVQCRVMEQIDEPSPASVVSPSVGQYGYAAFDGSDETTWVARRVNEDGVFVLNVELDNASFIHRLEVTPAEEEPRPFVIRIHDRRAAIARAEFSNDGSTQIVQVCRGPLKRFNLRIVSTHPEGAPTAGIRRIVVKERQ